MSTVTHIADHLRSKSESNVANLAEHHATFQRDQAARTEFASQRNKIVDDLTDWRKRAVMVAAVNDHVVAPKWLETELELALAEVRKSLNIKVR